jgi:hypothetical protein
MSPCQLIIGRLAAPPPGRAAAIGALDLAERCAGIARSGIRSTGKGPARDRRRYPISPRTGEGTSGASSAGPAGPMADARNATAWPPSHQCPARPGGQ